MFNEIIFFRAPSLSDGERILKPRLGLDDRLCEGFKAGDAVRYRPEDRKDRILSLHRVDTSAIWDAII